MSRHQDSVPSYRCHKQSGQAIVTLTDRAGNRRDVLLGKYGSADSRIEYSRVIAEWVVAGQSLLRTRTSTSDSTINELLLPYWAFVEQHYRRADGTATNEQNEIKYSLRPLEELYGHTLAIEFGPLALKACRQKMIKNGLARPVVNNSVGRIRRFFKWAVENELVPSAILQALQAVSGLQRGRTQAREPDRVRPVAEELVQKTLPFAPPPVAALVQLQLLTGARSGELVTMRTVDLNMSGRVWVYTPRQHKTVHRGRSREIYLGPRAQQVLRPWLKTELEAFIFSPAEAEKARNAEKWRSRKTQRWPSHVRQQTKMRRRARGKRTHRDHYTTGTYLRAIVRACARAFPPPEPLAKNRTRPSRNGTSG